MRLSSTEPGRRLRGRGPSRPRVAIPRDSVRQVGLSYALVTVVGADRRAFANERGGCVITGLRPGPERVRVQHIGYRVIAPRWLDPRPGDHH